MRLGDLGEVVGRRLGSPLIGAVNVALVDGAVEHVHVLGPRKVPQVGPGVLGDALKR